MKTGQAIQFDMRASPANRGRARHSCRAIARAAVLLCLLISRGAFPQTPRGPVPAANAPATEFHHTAEKGPVRLEATLPAEAIRAGEEFELRVRISAERGVQTALPEFGGFVGMLELVRHESKAVDCEPDHECVEHVLTLRAFLPGPSEIPALPVAFADPRPKMDGSDAVYQDTVSLDAIPITVEESLAGMKGPVELPIPWPMRLWWWAAAAVVAVGIAALIVRWWRRRPARPAVVPPAPVMSAYEWATRELRVLIDDDLIGRGRIQEFYYRINGLVRRYIEMRFGLMSAEQTSEEFVRDIQSAGWMEASQRETLRAFVSACDPVKYAKQTPTTEEVTWVLHVARDFIEATKDALGARPVADGSGPMLNSARTTADGVRHRSGQGGERHG